MQGSIVSSRYLESVKEEQDMQIQGNRKTLQPTALPPINTTRAKTSLKNVIAILAPMQGSNYTAKRGNRNADIR